VKKIELASPALDLEAGLYRLYREFFDKAERKRRWSLQEDIPWKACNPEIDPAVADVVESFLTVELYLPDYVANAMTKWRGSRASTWFYANWGYEESKHSLALGDWLLRSKLRTDEQMADLEGKVFQWQWQVPHDNPVAMLAYAMTQELATGLTYRNLQQRVSESRDPALSKLLGFLGVDEQAHHDFFRRAVQLFLQHDRPGTIHQLHRVLHNFSMPAIHAQVDGQRRIDAIEALHIFDGQMYVRDVYMPILSSLGVSRLELRKGGSEPTTSTGNASYTNNSWLTLGGIRPPHDGRLTRGVVKGG
jgi:acyl-[acyl-carrier-protein] desaturase